MSAPLLFIAGGALIVFAIAVSCRALFARSIWYALPRPLFVGACVATLAGLALLITGAIVASNHEIESCARSGGRLVADGPPIYVKSGNVMIPVQSSRCVIS